MILPVRSCDPRGDGTLTRNDNGKQSHGHYSI